MGLIARPPVPGAVGALQVQGMNNTRFSVVFVLSVVVLAIAGAQGCAAEESEGGVDADQVHVSVDESAAIPQRLGAGTGYQPRVMRTDFVKPAGSCTAAGLCTSNGVSWNCSGPGYCSRISE
jgi:hypothetical protein